MSQQLLGTASKHPFSLSAFIDHGWNYIREAIFCVGWTPLTRLAEAAVVALMQKITIGHLRVRTPSSIYAFPSLASPAKDGGRDLCSELRVVNDVFWIRSCTMGDLGFAEAYMYGDVECDDLVSLFRIFLENKENLSNMNSTVSYLFALPHKITSFRFVNSLSNSRSNISAHYDISNDMFRGFLSEDMTYSCAIFNDLDNDIRNGSAMWNDDQGLKRLPSNESSPSSLESSRPPSPTATLASSESNLKIAEEQDELYDAQLRKLHHIIRKARIFPHQRILEIGSGWGSLSILIAQTVPDTKIDTLTLSVQQQVLAQQRIRDAGLEDRITVHLMDYRTMPPEWEGAFDRVVSVEMIEAVGAEYLEKYWQVVDWAMKRKDGAGVVQVITIPEARYDNYIQEIDFIRKWVIFPGGFLPTVTLLAKTIASGSHGRLVIDSMSNIGPHYARTLREWRRRFLAHFDDVIVPALEREHPEVMGGPKGREEIEVFKRKWLYYYCYCEVGFATRTLGDHIITFTREGYQGYGCEVYE